MALKLSVVIAARNCEERIQGTVLPWKNTADEIIVTDQMSSDRTAEVARGLGCKVIENEPADGNFDLNRKLGMQKASGDYILYIDTDERPTPELLQELREFLKDPSAFGSPSGIKIPNEFYFLGKPLKHGLYNPRSAEIRMVRKDKWNYPCEKGFHHGVFVTDGSVITFKNPYRHFNVNSLSEWFIKTNQYTELDADKKALAYTSHDSFSGLSTYGAFWDAWKFFVKHYIFKLGFLDGFHGLVSVFYFMLYHLTLRVKVWEKVYRKQISEEKEYLKPFSIPRR